MINEGIGANRPKMCRLPSGAQLNRGSCGLAAEPSCRVTPASPATFRTGRAPRRSGGRQLTLYLKVATICPGTGGEWSGAAMSWADWSPRSYRARCARSNLWSSHRAESPRPARCDIRGPWRYYHTRSDPWRQYLPIMMEALRLSRPVVMGVNRGARGLLAF